MFALRQDHAITEQKYRLLREVVFEEVEREFHINAKPITLSECHKANKWENLEMTGSRKERGGWNWDELYKSYMNKPNRFEIALIAGGQLGALAYGQTSRAGSRVRLDFIEATPVRPSPLGRKALPVLSYAASLFAEVTGADEIWVVEPFPALENVYKSVGFGARQTYHQNIFGQMKKRLL